tara:strand:- start:141 stop:326 length:186 start_codon:yes stop_codon:yes gene_type:complete
LSLLWLWYRADDDDRSRGFTWEKFEMLFWDLLQLLLLLLWRARLFFLEAALFTELVEPSVR